MEKLLTKFPVLLFASLMIVGITIVPIFIVFSSWSNPATEIWQHMADNLLSELIYNSFVLCIGVSCFTALIGTTLAWLTASCEYPGRRIFSWALLLPLAMPTYVLAFVFLGIFDFAGPVQGFFRNSFGTQIAIEARSSFSIITVMGLALYPYVYLLARGAFVSQGKSLHEAAISLGCSPKSAFFKVALPMARPWIVGGVLLVTMETLADFGAVSIFSYNTFTTAIYKAWYGFFSIEAASQLSSILIVIVFCIIIMEQQSRKNRQYSQSAKHSTKTKRLRLHGKYKWLACSYSSFILFIAFVLPVTQLLVWFFTENKWFNSSYFLYLSNSLQLSLLAACLVLICSVLLSYTQRMYINRTVSMLIKTATLGYALPGTILAVGLYKASSIFDKTTEYSMHFLGIQWSTTVQGTIVTMILAYGVRFMAAGFNPVNSALGSVSKSIDEAACSLKSTGLKLIGRVHVPMLRKGIITAAILIFIDVMKEMPITLMTRPFGWDTLAVKIFELTSEGEWNRAAIPAIILIAGGLLPVIFLTKQVDS